MKNTKEFTQKNKIHQNTGITLIALVITIIVLLILAGISISMLSGDNGILQRATTAKENTDNAQITERVQLAYTAAIADGNGVLTEQNLRTELTNEFGDNYNLGEDTTTNEWVISVNEVERLRVSKGVATPTEPQSGESGYAGGSYNDPYIPVGFTHTGSEDWNHGYTITGNVDGTNPGDQFVWVPCSTEETPPAGVVKFKKITTGKYRNIYSTLHPSGGTNASVNAEDVTVSEIRTSIGTYGGFYIAKYEAGIMGTTDNANLLTQTATDGNVKPLSQSGVGVWNYITRENCLTVSKSMIPTATTGAKSTLISGECWDTTLAWITATADSSYAENSAGKGWYNDVSSNSIHTTGYYGTNTNNIFDMGGNVWEHTSENCLYDDGDENYVQEQVSRGGCFSVTYSSGLEDPASVRDTGGQADYRGFRVVLYK